MLDLSNSVKVETIVVPTYGKSCFKINIKSGVIRSYNHWSQIAKIRIVSLIVHFSFIPVSELICPITDKATETTRFRGASVFPVVVHKVWILKWTDASDINAITSVAYWGLAKIFQKLLSLTSGTLPLICSYWSQLGCFNCFVGHENLPNYGTYWKKHTDLQGVMIRNITSSKKITKFCTYGTFSSN